MLIYQSFFLLYHALNLGQKESRKKALFKFIFFRKCFSNSVTEFSCAFLIYQANFNLLKRILRP